MSTKKQSYTCRTCPAYEHHEDQQFLPGRTQAIGVCTRLPRNDHDRRRMYGDRDRCSWHPDAVPLDKAPRAMQELTEQVKMLNEQLRRLPLPPALPTT